MKGKKKTTEEFIIEAYCKHGDKYNYKFIIYKNTYTKVKIICPIHGVFEQEAKSHLKGLGCNKCGKIYKKKIYSTNNIPVYNTYQPQLQPYGVECRRSPNDENILEVRCMYCGKWYQPTLNSINHKIKAIKGKQSGENNLYCSDNCKLACPTYKQHKYPKGFKQATSREVQPALRKLVLERDNYTCQKCEATDKQLHCHHITGIELNPIESADIDNSITLCIDCHNEVHKQKGCTYNDFKRKDCKK